MIPKLIHQTWKSKIDIPDNFKFWSESFINLNPEYEYKIYDDYDNLVLIETYAEGLVEVYKSFQLEIYRVDFVRAIYLHFIGGIYADMDCQCLTSLSKLNSINKAVFCSMGDDLEFEHSIPNAMMASIKGHAFWIFYLYKIVTIQKNILNNNLSPLAPEFLTGPVMLKESIRDYQLISKADKSTITTFYKKYFKSSNLIWEDLYILPSNTWFPLNWNDLNQQKFRQKILNENILFTVKEAKEIFPNSDAITYWTHTWPGVDIGIELFGKNN